MLQWFIPLVLGLIALTGATAVSAAPVKHPNLLLNREELAQIREKVARYGWASKLLDKVRELAKDGANVREAALCYALTGERLHADRARASLLSQARYDMAAFPKVDLNVQPEAYAWVSWSTYAWAYDLTYDTFSDEERRSVEDWLRAGCRVTMEGRKRTTTTPNLVFGQHFNVGVAGYCLGDRELIEWGLNDSGGKFGPSRGGFYQVMDSMIKDGAFWAEAPIYALHYDVHGMLALAEAALHYDGTDLYHWVSEKSGASIKSLIDGYLLMGYPLEETGEGGGAVRMATYGDGSTGYGVGGWLNDTCLTEGLYFGAVEVAYKRYGDPGYAWLLSLRPARDANVVYGRAMWGYVALTHGQPLPDKLTPPPAPSGVYTQGFAMIRADESPGYWTSGALAAMVMLGKAVGHGHQDHYGLVLHGKGRLLYPDLNVIQYEPTYLSWTHEGIGHSTLLVDHQSPASGDYTTSQDFAPEVKFFAITGSAYKNIRQTRRLLLTKEYLADVFHAADQEGQPRTFDWALHGLGRLYPGRPTAYRPTDALVPYYWWVHNERGRTVDATFQMDWIQRTAGITEGRQFGPEWFQHEVGSRMTMLGVPGTEIYYGDGPITSGEP